MDSIIYRIRYSLDRDTNKMQIMKFHITSITSYQINVDSNTGLRYIKKNELGMVKHIYQIDRSLHYVYLEIWSVEADLDTAKTTIINEMSRRVEEIKLRTKEIVDNYEEELHIQIID